MKTETKTKIKNILEYISKTSAGMALGLFSTLILGAIIGQIGKAFELSQTTFFIGEAIISISSILKMLMGAGIGVGVALSLKQLKPIEIISCGIVGLLACSIVYDVNSPSISILLNGNGNPLMAYIATIGAISINQLILKKSTPIDILLIPLLYLIIGLAFTYLFIVPVTYMIFYIQEFVEIATSYQPILMGIVIAVVMGMCLTAPISSVAISVAINLSGIAAGAAAVGCCVQMVGFAVQSIKVNNVGKVISVGIGTSMLQFSNIIKHPIIWLPTIIVSAILGPLSTSVFFLQCSSIGAGMGTCALIGPIEIMTTMYAINANIALSWSGMILLCIVLPIILVFVINILFKKIHLIKDDYLKI